MKKAIVVAACMFFGIAAFSQDTSRTGSNFNGNNSPVTDTIPGRNWGDSSNNRMNNNRMNNSNRTKKYNGRKKGDSSDMMRPNRRSKTDSTKPGE